MGADKHIKNVSYSIASFLATFWIFRFSGISLEPGFWFVNLLLLLIYFEFWDISKKN